MISKSKVKTIKSLEYKKYRMETGLFLAEGKKLITSLLDAGIRLELLISTPDNMVFFQPMRSIINEIIEASEEEIRQASLLKNPQGCMALCRIPDYRLPTNEPKDNLLFCLDSIQDPGNLGTIIRIADWFGISDIVCSTDTADVYNPKVVQATMGAISQVRVHYTSLQDFLKMNVESQIPVFGTLLEGENIYTTTLSNHGIVVFGNEGNGISTNLFPYISHKITIPGFNFIRRTSESLNVATAVAITVSEFRRRIF